MQHLTLFVFAAVVAMALAGGQYYVPRAYYVIDAEGHASAPVPLRRLRRSLNPYPYSGSSANANANAHADARSWGGDANANANANAEARANGAGGWQLPAWNYGSSNPNALSSGQTRRQYGPILDGHSVAASSSAGIDSTGRGYYDQYTSVHN